MAGGGCGDWQAKVALGLDAWAEGCVEKSDIAMVEKIEGLGDDIQVAGTEGNHLQDAHIQVDVLGGRKRVAGVAERAGNKWVDVLAIAVESDDRIGSIAAGHAQDGGKFETCQEPHDRAWVGVGCGILGITQIGADKPKTAQGHALTLVLKRDRPLIV